MSKDIINESSCAEIIIDEDAAPLDKRTAKVSWPAVSYNGSDHLYLNVLASKLFGCQFVRISSTPKYIIFAPTNEEAYDVFRLKKESSGGAMSMRVPAALKEKRLSNGVYKLYRCKYGFCIKRTPEIKRGGKRVG